MSLENAKSLLDQAAELVKEEKYDQAVEFLSQVKEESGELYAKAQFKLGFYFYKLNEFRESEEYFLNVKREDSTLLYVKAQINLGILYKHQEKFQAAEDAYTNVKQEYDSEQYARAQFLLSLLYGEKNDLEKAEKSLKRVLKNDSKLWFASAQVKLGNLYSQQKKFKEAEDVYSSVQKEDDSKQFARAQLYLGLMYKQQGKFQAAEDAYTNIKKEYDPKQFARAQFCLGVMYKQQGNFEQAEQRYNQVLKQDSELWYPKAQTNLGILYKQQGKFQAAEEAFKKVQYESTSEQFSRAYVELGNLYSQQDKFKEAEDAYTSVQKEYDSEQFARAQFCLGLMYKRQENFEQAEQRYNQVLKQDSESWYSKAQINLGVLYFDTDKREEAKIAYKNAIKFGDAELFARAQWNLYILSGNKKHLENIKIEHGVDIFAEACYTLGELSKLPSYRNKNWQKIDKNTDVYIKHQYMIESTEKILMLNSKKYNSTLFEVLNKTNQILDEIFVDSEFENSIAHYTTTIVSKLLLSSVSDSNGIVHKVKSPLRLNTVNLMNDPVEGNLLHNYIGFHKYTVNREQAFIACFTLHHDSLNQFRLYGKNKNQEASGLSLVLNKHFFSDTHNAASIYTQDNKISHKDITIDAEKLETIVSDKDEKSDFNKNIGERRYLPSMPLYRCIYLDPTSKYVSVAQREKWSFCREDKKPHSKRWLDYQKYISKIENKVRELLLELSGLVEIIPESQKNGEVGKLMNEILLPLQYLIKHMAFKEEQECRMVYVTQMDNDLIQYDEQISRIYIDYEPSVMEHLEKIYIAPKAKDEQTVFEYLCMQGKKLGVNTKGVKVKISQNPFR